MLTQIERSLRKECGIAPGTLLIVGVSGGPDSLCLLHALHELGHRPVVAHFDHQLRSSSADEAARVAELAASLHLPFEVGRGDVSAYSTSKKMSVEEAGRELRYSFLLGLARSQGAIAVAVGHTADDQAETVLMHLVRGTGLSGLSGMAPRVILSEFDASIPIVRPLLGVWRSETLHYCRLNDLSALHDISNESRAYFRNRVRLDLIPGLELYNPQIRKALVRLAQSSAADAALLEEMVTEAWTRTLVRQDRGFLEFHGPGMAAERPAVQRRLVVRAARQLHARAELEFDALLRAEGFIADPLGRQMQLGDGVQLYREGQRIYMVMDELELPSDGWPQSLGDTIRFERDSPAYVALAGNWKFTSRLAVAEPASKGASSTEERYSGRLDADSLAAQLELRVPHPGDRIRPLGLNGHTQKLSDVFINIGVPERLRKRWPVLVSGDVVAWIPGFRIAEPFRIRKASRRTVVVAVYRPG